MREELLQAVTIAAQGPGIEHGLRRLIVDENRDLLHERTELRRANADHQTWVGAELAAALNH
ncbi:hypothetical protein D3C77_815520 [compost metagenome]